MTEAGLERAQHLLMYSIWTCSIAAVYWPERSPYVLHKTAGLMVLFLVVSTRRGSTQLALSVLSISLEDHLNIGGVWSVAVSVRAFPAIVLSDPRGHFETRSC